MQKKIIYYIKEILFVIIFMTVIANIISLYKSQSLNKEQLKIKQFHLIDNSIYTIDTSKPILIHFWATWCPTCKLESANVAFLSKYYNVITIAVNSGSDYELHQYLQERKLTFKVVNDKNAQLSQLLNIHAYPTTFIYDQKQELVFSEVGYTSTMGLLLRMWWIEYLK